MQKLLEDTQQSLYDGIKAAIAGATLDEVGGAIEDIAKANTYGIVRTTAGTVSVPTIMRTRSYSTIALVAGSN